MGGGIAYQSALKGVPVIMKDIAQASLDLGMTEASKLLNKQLERGKIDGFKMAGILASITPSLHYAGIDNTDIIVEAVVENPKVKAAVLSEVEEQVSEETVLTSNTSTIPINLLAKSLKRPENVANTPPMKPSTVSSLTQPKWANPQLWSMTAQGSL